MKPPDALRRMAELAAEIAEREAERAELSRLVEAAPTPGEQIVAIGELARDLGVEKATLRRYLERNGLGTKIGGRWYARRSEVEHLRRRRAA